MSALMQQQVSVNERERSVHKLNKMKLSTAELSERSQEQFIKRLRKYVMVTVMFENDNRPSAPWPITPQIP